MTQGKYVAWWSAGATSIVCTKLLLDEFGPDNVDIVYFDIKSAHEDNARVIRECEEWYGKKIEVVSGRYRDQFDVIEDTGYINGPAGARCTTELKKKLRLKLQSERTWWIGQAFGFEYDRSEINRALRFKDQYPETNPIFPLIDRQLTKTDCISIMAAAGIAPPMMYRLGYSNNNCIGCVKGGISYWNKIRVDFPDVFAEMAELERVKNRSCLKERVWTGEYDLKFTDDDVYIVKVMESVQLFLDELDPNRGRNMPIIMPDCGSMCEIKYTEVDHPDLMAVVDPDYIFS